MGSLLSIFPFLWLQGNLEIVDTLKILTAIFVSSIHSQLMFILLLRYGDDIADDVIQVFKAKHQEFVNVKLLLYF